AARRFLDQLVDDAELERVARRELERLRRALALRGVAVEDRRARLGRDHRIPAVLQHQEPVADADGERAARAALADHDRDDRYLQRGHLLEADRDRFRLTALL